MSTDLNKLLKSPTKLNDEANTYPNDCPLINLLIELTNNNYDFTRFQFKRIFCQIVYTIGRSNFLESDKQEFKNITTYLFTNYDISESQFFELCDDHTKCACDILFAKQYNFTLEHFSRML